MTRLFLLALPLWTLTGLAADSTKEVRKTVPLNAKGRVSVDTYKGYVTVTTWDQPQVEVLARIEPDGFGWRDNDLVQQTEIEFDASADSVRLKTRYPKLSGWFESNWSQPIARYTIRMPRTAELRIKDYKSEIDVEGLSAPLEIDTYKGDVKVRKQDGAISVKTYKSAARITFARYSARSSFETYRGSYDISLPRDSKFDVNSEVGRRGSLQTSFQMLMPAGSRHDGRNFRTSINGGGPPMTLKGYRGDFNLR